MAKKVIYYLKGIMYLNLIYNSYFKDEKEIKALITLFLFRLIRYRDSSYTRDLEDKKSIIRYCYFINRVVVSSYSKKQRNISIFTTKVEYIALEHIVQEVI